MKKNRTVALLCLVIALLLGGAYALYQNLSGDYAPDQLTTQPPHSEASEPSGTGSQETTAPAPQQAPNFTVYDLEGNPVELHDFFGKPIVLNFWASWCGPCKMEMPDFDAKFRELGDEVQFLMVNVTSGRETLESASSFIAEKGFGFPVFYDTDLSAATTYGASGLPTTFFIDAEGYPVAQARGTISAETLQQGIDMIYTK